MRRLRQSPDTDRTARRRGGRSKYCSPTTGHRAVRSVSRCGPFERQENVTVAVVAHSGLGGVSRALAEALVSSGFSVCTLPAEDEGLFHGQLATVFDDAAAVIVLVEGGQDAAWFASGFAAGCGRPVVLIADRVESVPTC